MLTPAGTTGKVPDAFENPPSNCTFQAVTVPGKLAENGVMKVAFGSVGEPAEMLIVMLPGGVTDARGVGSCAPRSCD